MKNLQINNIYSSLSIIIILFFSLDFFLIEKDILFNVHLDNYLEKFLNPFTNNDFYQRFSSAALIYIIHKFIFFEKIEILQIAIIFNKLCILLTMLLIYENLQEINFKKRILWFFFIISTPTFIFTLVFNIYFLAFGQLLLLLSLISKNLKIKLFLFILMILNHPVFLFYIPLYILLNNEYSYQKIKFKELFYVLIIYILYLYLITNFGYQSEIETEYKTRDQNYNFKNNLLNEIVWRLKFLSNKILNINGLYIPIVIIFSLELLWIIAIEFYKKLKNNLSKLYVFLGFIFLFSMFLFGEDFTKYLLPLNTLIIYLILADNYFIKKFSNKILYLSFINLLIINIYGFGGKLTISNNLIINYFI